MGMTEEKQKLVDRLKELMEEKDVSIYRVAKIAGVSYPSMHNLIDKGVGQVGNEKIAAAIAALESGEYDGKK